MVQPGLCPAGGLLQPQPVHLPGQGGGGDTLQVIILHPRLTSQHRNNHIYVNLDKFRTSGYLTLEYIVM